MAYILIVEAQTPLHEQLARLIEERGHHVMVVATLKDASDILTTIAPDILAADATLIDGSSDNLVRQAKDLGAKIIMMTGSPERIIEFDGAGQPYLSKPFPPEALVEKVEEVLAAPPPDAAD
jgi:DNA-binding response OmpR family regulator